MLRPARKIATVAAAVALCVGPTAATAATTAPVQSINPLVAVSIFGTQASAQVVCANPATAAAAAGAAAVAQGRAGCVLPATDAPLPPPEATPTLRPPGFGISPIILGLLGIAALAALIAGGNDDSDSPVSPS